MLRQLLRETAIYGVTGLVTRGLQIVLVPVYTRFLSPVEYGALDYVLMLAALANLTVALEITQGLARRFADVRESRERARYASTALLFTAFCFSLFATLVGLFSGELAALLLDSADHAALLRVAGAAVAANGILALLQDVLRWNMQPWRYAAVALLFSVISATVGVYLVVAEGVGVIGIFWGQIAGAAVAVAACWTVSRRYYLLSFDRRRCLELLAYSAPLVLSSAAVFLNLYVDRIAIKELLGLDAVGVYGVGARFAMVAALFLVGFQSAMTPLVFQRHDEPSTPAAIARGFRYYLAASVPFVLLTAFYPGELLWLFATEPYYAAWPVLTPLSTGLVLANAYLFAPGLFLGNKTLWVAAVNVSSAALNVALNIALIPHIGIAGAALATMAAAFMAAGLYLYLGTPRYRVPHDWRRLAAGCSLAALAAVVMLATADPPLVSAWGAVLKLPAYVCAVSVSVWLFLGTTELRNAAGKLRRHIGSRVQAQP
jgi:O-antigen/teichoic acid export membrane protein